MATAAYRAAQVQAAEVRLTTALVALGYELPPKVRDKDLVQSQIMTLAAEAVESLSKDVKAQKETIQLMEKEAEGNSKLSTTSKEKPKSTSKKSGA